MSSAISARSVRLSPEGHRRLSRKIRAGYLICRDTLDKAGEALRRNPDPELERKVGELKKRVNLMEDFLRGGGLDGFFIPILLAATVVAGLVGSVGISKYISSKVPTLSQDQIQKGIKIGAGLSLIGIGLYAASKSFPARSNA